MKKFICDQCQKEKMPDSELSTGYGTNKEGKKICFECIGKNDLEEMTNAKRGQKFTLYLCNSEVSNWPGSFKSPIYGLSKGRHNIARYRYDFYFNVGKNKFHGVQFGDNTQIAHCKAIK